MRHAHHVRDTECRGGFSRRIRYERRLFSVLEVEHLLAGKRLEAQTNRVRFYSDCHLANDAPHAQVERNDERVFLPERVHQRWTRSLIVVSGLPA